MHRTKNEPKKKLFMIAWNEYDAMCRVCCEKFEETQKIYLLNVCEDAMIST